ncbi:MAG: esterase family protein, partial [Mycobacteriaceae bacterium]|nr:esterase family protein [Mycobacteriaceae bacterium]
HHGPTWASVFVFSPAMGRVMEVHLLHPRGKSKRPRPTYYLLDGVESPESQSNWTRYTDAVPFFADKDVNVVMPAGGRGSYYTDWRRPDPALGTMAWETFLTAELPPLVDRELHGNGSNVIGGLSMGGTASAILAVRHPELYRGIAVFSGCPDAVTPDARFVIRQSVARQGGDPDNMWGPDADPAWLDHDPLISAVALRGKAIYLAVGSGVPGPQDLRAEGYPRYLGLAMPLESAARVCTEMFQVRLRSLGIPATYSFHSTGTHAWPYWQDDLHESWPMLAAALQRPGP